VPDLVQGLTDDWRVRLAFPFFLLIDFLLSRQRIARWLFDGFRTKENLRKALLVCISLLPNHLASAQTPYCGQNL
jgi:hypothetical protein